MPRVQAGDYLIAAILFHVRHQKGLAREATLGFAGRIGAGLWRGHGEDVAPRQGPFWKAWYAWHFIDSRGTRVVLFSVMVGLLPSWRRILSTSLSLTFVSVLLLTAAGRDPSGRVAVLYVGDTGFEGGDQ